MYILHFIPVKGKSKETCAMMDQNVWESVEDSEVEQQKIINQIRGILRLIEDRSDILALSFHVHVEDGRLLAGNQDENVVGFEYGKQPALFEIHQAAISNIVYDLVDTLYPEENI